MSHFGQLPAVTIGSTSRPGFALGDAVDSDSDARRPRRCRRRSRSSSRARRRPSRIRSRGLGLVLLMAIVVIYIVLGVLYESFTHPLTILSGLPAAGLGALLTLMIFRRRAEPLRVRRRHHARRAGEEERHHDGGLRASRRRSSGRRRTEAIHEACLVRFRPIMMTTMAALVGTLPIALGLGRRRRIAAAARSGGRRRPDRVAAADALHHAGLLQSTSRGCGCASSRKREPATRPAPSRSAPRAVAGRGHGVARAP